MTKTGEARECGEFWFLVPPANSSLDKRDKDHRVLLLVDKEEYDTNSEVIVYIPTSHVLLHNADMLSIQLLHDGPSIGRLLDGPSIGLFASLGSAYKETSKTDQIVYHTGLKSISSSKHDENSDLDTPGLFRGSWSLGSQTLQVCS